MIPMRHADKLLLALALSLMLLSACSNETKPEATVTKPAENQTRIQKQEFGKTADGQAVDIYTLTNAHGMEARITNYGGTVVSLKAPDRSGKMEDVVLGYDNLDSYLKDTRYF